MFVAAAALPLTACPAAVFFSGTNHHPRLAHCQHRQHHHSPQLPQPRIRAAYNSTMANTMLQYQATQQGGPFALATVPKPTPEPTDVCIRIKAVALNPLDWKMASRGEMVQAWPATFGLDGAGIVEAVGDQVTNFQPGDEVFSLCGIGGKTAGFQDIVTVSQHFVSKKPASRSFEEVVSLP